MRQLHIVIDSPTEFPVIKTELDIGVVTRPYLDIAHCIRAALCISHDLRRWVQVTICFDRLGPLALHLDPRTIRFLGTDERSILHIILRGQEASRRAKRPRRVPHGITIYHATAEEMIAQATNSTALLLLPGPQTTWQRTISKSTTLVMYCPLSPGTIPEWTHRFNAQYYQDTHRRDLAILQLLHQLDSLQMAREKD